MAPPRPAPADHAARRTAPGAAEVLGDPGHHQVLLHRGGDEGEPVVVPADEQAVRAGGHSRSPVRPDLHALLGGGEQGSDALGADRQQQGGQAR
ncbi:hypothetical protein, partial [Frankia sp. CpI1-P]|uniref:hypothetical protein n=1 Tax=Frankia sp. CpI1-P TaxID=1502734 RepID=UPI001A7E5659